MRKQGLETLHLSDLVFKEEDTGQDGGTGQMDTSKINDDCRKQKPKPKRQIFGDLEITPWMLFFKVPKRGHVLEKRGHMVTLVTGNEHKN